jgi:predicted kinase
MGRFMANAYVSPFGGSTHDPAGLARGRVFRCCALAAGPEVRNDPAALSIQKAVMTDITKTPPSLIVLSGLPGSGKTALAEGLSRNLSIPVFSVDPIEAAMWRAGLDKSDTGVAAYEVVHALADEHLRLRIPAIVDAVNPVEAPRAAWRKLASKHRVTLKIIECVCSDETILRQRIESRVRSVAATHELTWAGLQKRRAEYEAWTDQRLVLDTAHTSPAQLLTQALAYVR